jgi:hypothetical protein
VEEPPPRAFILLTHSKVKAIFIDCKGLFYRKDFLYIELAAAGAMFFSAGNPVELIYLHYYAEIMRGVLL